jgi:hypothetical protein
MKEIRDSDDFARTGFCRFAGGILYPSLYKGGRTDNNGWINAELLNGWESVDLGSEPTDSVEPDPPVIEVGDD